MHRNRNRLKFGPERENRNRKIYFPKNRNRKTHFSKNRNRKTHFSKNRNRHRNRSILTIFFRFFSKNFLMKTVVCFAFLSKQMTFHQWLTQLKLTNTKLWDHLMSAWSMMGTLCCPKLHLYQHQWIPPIKTLLQYKEWRLLLIDNHQRCNKSIRNQTHPQEMVLRNSNILWWGIEMSTVEWNCYKQSSNISTLDKVTSLICEPNSVSRCKSPTTQHTKTYLYFAYFSKIGAKHLFLLFAPVKIVLIVGVVVLAICKSPHGIQGGSK